MDDDLGFRDNSAARGRPTFGCRRYYVRFRPVNATPRKERQRRKGERKEWK